MNLHAWIVAATELPESDVWRAYQNSAHEPPNGTDYVTYDEGASEHGVYLLESYDLPDEGESVPEEIIKTYSDEVSRTVTIRVFGPSMEGLANALVQSGSKSSARVALGPSVFQRIVGGTKRQMRLQREEGWMEWIQFDVLIHEPIYTSETVPTVQGSVIEGDLGGMPVEVIEP